MGQYLSTRIAYGYSIGGPEDGWQFEEYDEREYEMRWPGWVDRDALDDDSGDFIDQAKDRLLTVIGGFEDSDDWMQEGELRDAYYDRKSAAEKKAGVKFMTHGVGGYREWVLGFELARSSSSISEIDQELVAALLNPLNMSEMDYKLHEAVRVLQLHPRAQPAPRAFLLASYF